VLLKHSIIKHVGNRDNVSQVTCIRAHLDD